MTFNQKFEIMNDKLDIVNNKLTNYQHYIKQSSNSGNLVQSNTQFITIFELTKIVIINGKMVVKKYAKIHLLKQDLIDNQVKKYQNIKVIDSDETCNIYIRHTCIAYANPRALIRKYNNVLELYDYKHKISALSFDKLCVVINDIITLESSNIYNQISNMIKDSDSQIQTVLQVYKNTKSGRFFGTMVEIPINIDVNDIFKQILILSNEDHLQKQLKDIDLQFFQTYILQKKNMQYLIKIMEQLYQKRKFTFEKNTFLFNIKNTLVDKDDIEGFEQQQYDLCYNAISNGTIVTFKMPSDLHLKQLTI